MEKPLVKRGPVPHITRGPFSFFKVLLFHHTQQVTKSCYKTKYTLHADINVAVHNSGLDTNGCPLGNSKFILLSDNLNICLWLSACQVEKIIKLAWLVSHNVIGAIDNVSISCGHILAFAGLLSLCTLCYHLILWMKNCPDTCIGHDWDYQRWLLW